MIFKILKVIKIRLNICIAEFNNKTLLKVSSIPVTKAVDNVKAHYIVVNTTERREMYRLTKHNVTQQRGVERKGPHNTTVKEKETKL